MQVFLRNIAALIAVVLIPSVLAQQDEIAGRVISAAGDVFAEIENVNSVRQLVRRSEIYSGEVVITSGDAAAQLRLSDASLISLACNSSLKIEDYRFEDYPNDKVTLRLLSGRFRTITGRIAELNRESYRLLVGGTHVEVRGTDFEVVLKENGTVYFANYDGGITLVNSLGSLKLGIGGNVDFGVVEPGSAPLGLASYPQQLESTCF